MSLRQTQQLYLLTALALLSAGCRTAPKRAPGWACTALDPHLRLSQSFVATAPTLCSARIVVKPINRGQRGMEPITLLVLDRYEREIGRARTAVNASHCGWVAFAFPSPGLALSSGERYFLRAQGSRHLTFGWCQRRNFYAHGSLHTQGVAHPDTDCYFKLTWGSRPPERQFAALRP